MKILNKLAGFKNVAFSLVSVKFSTKFMKDDDDDFGGFEILQFLKSPSFKVTRYYSFRSWQRPSKDPFHLNLLGVRWLMFSSGFHFADGAERRITQLLKNYRMDGSG